jgi:arylsulfatase A-like enzyme
MTLMNRIVKAGGYACVAWIVCGAVEAVLSLGTRMALNQQAVVTSWQWRLMIALLAAYAVVGFVVGGLAGAILSRIKPSRENYMLMASLSLTLAYAANWIAASRRTNAGYIAAAIASVLAIGFSAGLVSAAWRKRFLFLASPFVLCLLLLSAPWLRYEFLKDEHSTLFNAALELATIGAVILGARLVYRMRGGLASPLRQSVAALALLALLAIPGAMRARAPSAPVNTAAQGKPNIVLVTLDTVRADHLPVYGYARDTSPNLRAFAGEATFFSRFFATSDFTLPTHASIFTGLYPGWFGPIYSAPPRQRPLPLQPGHPTLAELLRKNGYWTVGSVANTLYLSPATGLNQGFEVWEWEQPVTLTSRIPGLYVQGRLRQWLTQWLGAAGLERPYFGASVMERRSEAVLQAAAARQRPVFLFLNLMDAHWPYVADPPFDHYFLGNEPRFNPSYDFSRRVNWGSAVLSKEQQQALISEYDGGIAAADAALGRLFGELRRLGLYDNTMIVITSDHGEGFLDHGIMDHGKGLAYQNYLHVPLLIKYPGQHAGNQSSASASQVDLMPTIVDIAGLSPVPGMQGRSLHGIPRGESEAVFAQADTSAWDSRNPMLRGTRRAIISGNLKLITWSNGQSELYDLAADPGEIHNIYSTTDPRTSDLAKRLSDWVAAIPRPSPKPQKLDRSVMERLRSLGYTQ